MIMVGIVLFLTGCATGCFITKRKVKSIIYDVQINNRPPTTFECANALIDVKGITINNDSANRQVAAYDREFDLILTCDQDSFAYALLSHYGLDKHNFTRDKKGKVILK